MKKYDVVIIGFGPTGGTLANLLALHGFSILIVEKEKSFYPLPRAVHFDDEIMRVFQTIKQHHGVIAVSYTHLTLPTKA